MWKPADKNGIPNEEDQVHARRAIAQLQMELSTAMDLLPAAEVYVNRIIKVIEDRWAWLAPVRRVPFEIFSIIFIMAAEKNWRSPASIAGVCRFWRDVVLATPQAWNFLDLQGNPPPEIASMYLQRSGRCPVHLTVPRTYEYSAEYMSLATEIAHRMECLVVTFSSMELVLEDYQNLTRLAVGDHRAKIPLDYLDITRLPRLRYFDGAFSQPEVPQGENPCPRFPPIEHLIVTTDAEAAWLDAVRACARTLTALHINIGNKAAREPNPVVHLFRLKHLAIRMRWDSQRPWSFSAKTPCLETYNTNFEANAFTVRVVLNTVTQLQCSDVNGIDLSEYPGLLQLRVFGYQYETLRFIDKLRRDYEVCPTLQKIVVVSWDEAGLRQIARNLRKRNAATGVNLTVVPTNGLDGIWPGDIRSTVRVDQDI
jgi:hypothetical protein